MTDESKAKIFITGDLQCSVDGKGLTLNAKSGVIELNASGISSLLSLSRAPVLSRRLTVRLNHLSRLLSITSHRLDIYVGGVQVAAAGDGVSSLATSMFGIRNWRIWPLRLARQTFRGT